MSKLNKPDDFRKPLITKDDKHSCLRKIFSRKMLTSVSSGVTLLKNQTDPEIANKSGNLCFREGLFTEALKFYGRAIELDPKNASYHRNRAFALWRLEKFWEAVKECEQAINLDPNFVKVHETLAEMLLRLGQVDNARKHFVKEPSHDKLLAIFKNVETHLDKCAYGRRHDEWNNNFNEASAAIVSGANLSPQLEKWAEAVRDYEILSQALPCDKYIAKSLFQAQVALRFSRYDIEDVSLS